MMLVALSIPMAGKYPKDHAARPEKHLKRTDPFNSHGQLGKDSPAHPLHVHTAARNPRAPCPGPCKEQTAERRFGRWPPRFLVPELQSSTSPRGHLMNKELPRRPLLLVTSWDRMRRSPSSGVSPDGLPDSRQQAGKGGQGRAGRTDRQGSPGEALPPRWEVGLPRTRRPR